MVLAVNFTPVKGPTPSAAGPLNNEFTLNLPLNVSKQNQAICPKGKNVGVGDIAYGNGSDNALVKGLFTKTELLE